MSYVNEYEIKGTKPDNTSPSDNLQLKKQEQELEDLKKMLSSECLKPQFLPAVLEQQNIVLAISKLIMVVWR